MNLFLSDRTVCVAIVTGMFLTVSTLTQAANLNRPIDDLPKKFEGLVDMSHDAKEIDPTLLDPEHGVKMGIPSTTCDDGRNGIAIDWNPESSAEYTCHPGDVIELDAETVNIADTSKTQTMHVCLNEKIIYNTDLPLSGSHRPLWPKYGEYIYLPPQRWVHSLEHGAIALLYHPCMADTEELQALKSIVRGCLRKHVISPYRNISYKSIHNMPFALLAFRHAILISRFDGSVEDINMVTQFIKKYALRGPESHVLEDGQYSAGLVTRALKVSDIEEPSTLCPQF